MLRVSFRRTTLLFLLLFSLLLGVGASIAQGDIINLFTLNALPARHQVVIQFQVQVPEILPPDSIRFGSQVHIDADNIPTILSDDPDTSSLLQDPTFTPLSFNFFVTELPSTGQTPWWRGPVIWSMAVGMVFALLWAARKSRRWFSILLFGSILFLGGNLWVYAQSESSPVFALLVDDICGDTNNDGFAGPNEIICYTLTIVNGSDQDISNLDGDLIPQPFIGIIPGSVTIGDPFPITPDLNDAPTQVPSDDVSEAPLVSASASDDTFTVTNGTNNNENLLSNDAGTSAQVLNFGDSVANVGDNPADGSTTVPFATGVGDILVTVAANGDITIDASAIVSGNTGTITIFYEIQAADNTTDTAQVDITYGDFPTAEDDTTANGVTFNTPINTAFNNGSTGYATLLNNDTPGNPAGTLVSFGGGSMGGDASSNAAPASQTVVGFGTIDILDNAGNFEFTPETGFTGTFTFNYRLDNGVGTSEATVEIEVSLPAEAIDDTLSVPGGGSNNTDVVANDNGQTPLTVIQIADDAAFTIPIPADGSTPLVISTGGGTLSVTMNANGTLTATSAGTAGNNTVSVFYQLQAANGTTDIGQVDITYGDFPIASDDTQANGVTFETSINTAFNSGSTGYTTLLNNDNLNTPPGTLVSFGGGDLTGDATQFTAPGSQTATGFGIINIIDNAGNFEFTPETGFTGVFTFDYRLENTFGFSDASVEIYVTEAPTAVADSFQVSLGSVNTANNVTANDTFGFPTATVDQYSDVGGANPVTPTNTYTVTGSGGITVTIGTGGALTVDASTGTPNTYTFDYQITNSAGSSTATVTLNIVQGPTAENDAFTTDLGSGLTGNLTSDNGSGIDNPGTPAYDVLTFGGGDLPGDATTTTAGAGGTTVPLAGGTLSISSNGSISLTGETTPGTYTFDYQLESTTLSASDTATVTLTIQAAPTAVDDGSIASPAYTAAVGSTFGPTSDAAGVRNSNDDYTLPNVFPNATIRGYGTGFATTPGNAFTVAAGIDVTLTATGALTITTTGGAAPGDYQFSYRLSNGTTDSDATVFFRLTAAPVAANDVFTIDPTVDQTAPNSLFNDNTNGTDSLGFPNATITTFGSGDSGGTLGVTNPGDTVSFAGGNLTVNANGSWTLIRTGPTLSAGTFTFQYTISNGVAPDSTATVTITTELAPTAANDSGFTVLLNGTLTQGAGVLFADNGNGLDNLGTPTATIASFGGGDTTGGTDAGDIAANGVNSATLAGGTLIVDTDGSFSLTNPTTSGTFTFEYRLDNGVGSSDATVTIVVQEAPSAEDDTFNINFDGTSPLISGDLNVANGGLADNLGFPNATITSTTLGTVGTPISFAANGSITVNADGTISLTRTGNLTPGTYTFDYTISNGVAPNSTATVTINVYSPPTANDDAISVGLGASTGVVSAANGLIQGSGGGINPDDYTLPNVYDDASITGVVDADNGNAPLTLGTPYAIPGTGGATLTVNADGSYTLNATAASTGGTFNFSYSLGNSYPFGASVPDIATLTVTISTPPVAVDDPNGGLPADSTPGNDATVVGTDSPYHTALNTTLIVNVANGVLSNDTLGSPVATVIPFAGASTSGGSVALAADGSFSYTPPNMTFTGTDTFTYTLQNSAGTDTAAVTVAVGTRAVCVVDTYVGTANINFSINAAAGVLANDAGDQITVTQSMGATGNVANAVATTNGGIVTLNADGSFDYDPPGGRTGANSDSFTYAITNGFGEVTTNCTANITLNTDAGAVPWFIKRGAAGTNAGTFSNPFNSIASFNAVNNNTGNNPGNGDVIYIYADLPGFYNEADGINLLDGQDVYGGTVQFNTVFTASGTVSSAYTTFAATAEGGRTEIRTTGDDAFDIFANNMIRGFTIDSTAGYAFADSGFDIGTTTISDVSTFNNGGVFNLQNGGTINATLDRMSASVTSGGRSVIALNGIDGTITDTTAGSIIHTDNSNVFDIRNGAVSVTVSSPVTKTAGTGTGIFLSNADGTYNFTGAVDILSGGAGVNIVNGSDGTLNMTDTSSDIEGIQGIPFRINNSTMDVNYDGDITHRVGVGSDITSRTVEIIGGTGIISLDGTIATGDAANRASGETVFLQDTNVVNRITFNYVDTVMLNAPAFVSSVSGNVVVNRLRINCDGNLGANNHCVDISDTTSSGVTIETLRTDHDDAGEAGGAISLVNTPGVWTIEDTTLGAGPALGLAGRDAVMVYGINFGTLNLGTVTPSFISANNRAAIDLTNGNINITVTRLDSFEPIDHGINLVDVGGTLFRVTDNVTIDGSPTSNENIFIDNVTVPTIDIGTDGTTHNIVNLNDRQTHGVSASRSGTSTTVRFGNTNIPNPNSVPDDAVNPTPIPGWITFNSLTAP